MCARYRKVGRCAESCGGVSPGSSVFTPTTYSTHSDVCAALGESSFDLVTPRLADNVTPGSVKCIVCKWGGVQCSVMEFAPCSTVSPPRSRAVVVRAVQF